jgi:glycosyltransferase involved in cell wall biosynthesis
MLRLGYLSGAPRVTTRDDAELAGPRAHVLGVIDGFEAAGWTVDRYIVGDRLPPMVARDGERIVRRGWLTTVAADGARLAMRPRSARAAWRTLGGRVDWVYERFALFQALGLPFTRRGVPWVLETNALLSDEAHRERASVVLHSAARRLEREAYLACDALVVVSDELGDRLVADMGVPRAKIVVVPNGVDTRRFDPARTTARRVSEAFTVVFAGSLAPWQGLDTLLRAIGPGMHVVIAGDGPGRGDLEALAASLGITDRVYFLGRVAPADVPPLLVGADVCYVGHTDGDRVSAFRSPLKLYEYLAMGKPVISSTVPDAVAAIEPGRTGWLFRAGDVRGLADALAAAESTRACLGAMGEEARADAVAHHSWRARVRRMIDDVEVVLAEVKP